MTGSRERWVVRASVAGLLAVLCFLAGFSVITQQRVATESKRADTAMKLSATYQDARHWVTEAKSIERAYHFEGSEHGALRLRAGHPGPRRRPAPRRRPRPLAREPSGDRPAARAVDEVQGRRQGPVRRHRPRGPDRRPAARPRGHRPDLRRARVHDPPASAGRFGAGAQAQRLAAGARGARHPRDHGRVRRRAGACSPASRWSSCASAVPRSRGSRRSRSATR